MALIEDELKVMSIEEFFNLNLRIPDYQRMYKWSEESVTTIFQDIYEAYQGNVGEYRLGSVILHEKKVYKEDRNEEIFLDIVDGQQRLTTLAILLYCLINRGNDCEFKGIQLLEQEYSGLSKKTIVRNFQLLSKRIRELGDDEDKYKEYLQKQCTLVQIRTDNEQEAFQFFDSQNSRGKELAPHDLLKAYHLREIDRLKEMDIKDDEEKKKIVKNWEDKNQNEIEDLFKNYLFPLTQWYRKKSGIGYSKKDIKTFKGIRGKKVKNTNDNCNHNHFIYHKSASNGEKTQLTQPLIAGENFFKYVENYNKLREEISNKIKEKTKKTKEEKDEGIFIIPAGGTGDKYIRQLYENSLMFYADRFSIEEVNDSVMEILYTWCYSLRVSMHSIRLESINNYAKGEHEIINNRLDMFTKISEMSEPNEIKNIFLEKIKYPKDREIKNKKYSDVREKLNKINGWVGE